jgi:hypothetical protein
MRLVPAVLAFAGTALVAATAARSKEAAAPAVVSGTVTRFFDALRQDEAANFAAIAPEAYVGTKPDLSDGVRLNLREARDTFRDCVPAGAMTAREVNKSGAFDVTVTLKCSASAAATRHVVVLVDGARVLYVRLADPNGDERSRDQVQTPDPNALVSQRTLDLMASMPFAVPSGPFAGWTPEQKNKMPAAVEKFCTFMWTMTHDAPSTRFLPTASSDDDEWKLGIDICLTGHMPVDWPGRKSRLLEASAILKRAQNAGSTFRLPLDLTP